MQLAWIGVGIVINKARRDDISQGEIEREEKVVGIGWVAAARFAEDGTAEEEVSVGRGAGLTRDSEGAPVVGFGGFLGGGDDDDGEPWACSDVAIRLRFGVGLGNSSASLDDDDECSASAAIDSDSEDSWVWGLEGVILPTGY